MSLLSVLHDYNKSNYQLNPVIVNQEDYNTYYGGISNGLLWPALHNLPEYIVKDYDDEQVWMQFFFRSLFQTSSKLFLLVFALKMLPFFFLKCSKFF